jgi:hypothetical protein
MAARKRTPALLRSEVNARLEDLPLQIEALQSAMEEFGDDFELAEFKPAFERKAGIKSYNKSRPSNEPSAECRTTWSSLPNTARGWLSWNSRKLTSTTPRAPSTR